MTIGAMIRISMSVKPCVLVFLVIDVNRMDYLLLRGGITYRDLYFCNGTSRACYTVRTINRDCDSSICKTAI